MENSRTRTIRSCSATATPKSSAGKDGPTRRAQLSDLHLESKAIGDLLGKLSKKGLTVDHYSAQDKPLFELIEGEGERATVDAAVLHPGNS